MSSIDDQIRQDLLDDARERAYFRQNLSDAQNARLSDDDLQWVLDTITEYYALSGVLESAASDDDYIEINGEDVARHLAERAQADGYDHILPEDLLRLVELETEYED